MAHGRAGEVVEEEESICEPRIKATLPTQPKQSRFQIPLQSPRGVRLAASSLPGCRAWHCSKSRISLLQSHSTYYLVLWGSQRTASTPTIWSHFRLWTSVTCRCRTRLLP